MDESGGYASGATYFGFDAGAAFSSWRTRGVVVLEFVAQSQ
jgi:hypothetical protein